MDLRFLVQLAVKTMTEINDNVDSEPINHLITAATCQERGEDEGRRRGKMHVFRNYEQRCECGDIDLTKERTR